MYNSDAKIFFQISNCLNQLIFLVSVYKKIGFISAYISTLGDMVVLRCIYEVKPCLLCTVAPSISL